MEPITIQYSLNIPGAEQTTTRELTVDTDVLADFQQRMQGGASHQEQAAQSTDFNTVGEANPNSLGDKILSNLQQVKSGYDNQFNEVNQSLAGTDPLSVQDMMKFQYDLTKFSLQGELINKTVSKSTQNLDTLLRSQ